MRTISLSTNDRPHYLKETLDALKNCVGVKDWTLVVSLEPNIECWDMISQIGFMEVIRLRNQIQRGVNVNTFLAIESAFHLDAEYNVYLEDDVLLSRDALTLARQWAAGDRRHVLAFRRRQQRLVGGERHVELSDEEGLLGCGFVCGCGQWPHLRAHWFEVNPPQHKGETWDLALGDALQREGAKLWRPMINRSRHIGVTGTHTSPSNYVNEPLSGPHYEGCESEFLFVK